MRVPATHSFRWTACDWVPAVAEQKCMPPSTGGCTMIAVSHRMEKIVCTATERLENANQKFTIALALQSGVGSFSGRRPHLGERMPTPTRSYVSGSFYLMMSDQGSGFVKSVDGGSAA